jgi:hypothetical protein
MIIKNKIKNLYKLIIKLIFNDACSKKWILNLFQKLINKNVKLKLLFQKQGIFIL